MARIEQITDKTQVPTEYHRLYERIAASRGGHVRGPYSILFHNPALTETVEGVVDGLRESALTPQEFVLAAISVARAKDCLFIWSVQAPNARKAGFPDSVINAVRDRNTDSLEPDQADLVSYVRQVVAGNRVDQGTFDRLRERHGDRWLVDLTVCAGLFELIADINNAFEVAPAPEGEQLPV